MTSPNDTIESRFKKRNLTDLLVHKFLNEYGYDHGPVIARAIVADILATIERCWPERVPPKTIVWLAVRREWRNRRKGIDVTDLVPVHLPMVLDEELALLTNRELRRNQRARRAFCRARFARWCFEAYAQGGVLTLLDLSLMSGMSEHFVSEVIHEYEGETGKIVPTRGTVHDIGRSVTHKPEVIRRWLRNESPEKIAQAVSHSQDAVDRYIATFQKVRLLATKVPISDLPLLASMSIGLINEYIALLRQYEPQLALFSDNGQKSSESKG